MTSHRFGRIAVDRFVDNGSNPRVHSPLTEAEGLLQTVDWERTAYVDSNKSGREPRRFRWWAALLLLPLLGLIALATWFTVDRIQENVEAGSAQLLTDAGIDTTDLTFDASFRNVEVGGAIPTGASAEDIESVLEDGIATNGADIRDAIVVATKRFASFDVRASTDGSTVLLTGTVPLESHRAALIEAAEASGASVDDQLVVAGLDPAVDDPNGTLEQMTALLPRLGADANAGRLLLTDDAFIGEIEAMSPGLATSIGSIAPSTITLTSLGELEAAVTFDGSIVILDGRVLNDDQRARLAAAASSAVGQGRVIDNLEVLETDEAVEGSDDKIEAVAALLQKISSFDRADINFDDTTLTVAGVAFDPDAKTVIDALLDNATPTGLEVRDDITLGFEFTLEEEIDLLQAELDALQDEIRENVRFDSDSNGLSDAGLATLDMVVAAMNKFSRPVVEVGGHTDSQGDPGTNQQLSQRRATSVVDFVVSGGISADRLNPVGYGESQPVAENLLEAGRLQNRRVEFTARESF